MSEKSGVSISTVCKSLCANQKCPYANSAQTLAGEGIYGDDFEDIMENAKRSSTCPYQQTKQTVTSAEIILAPYTYVLDYSMRSGPMSEAIKDAVIVFDEGHSVVDQARSVNSCSFDTEMLDDAAFNVRLALRIANERRIKLRLLQRTDKQSEPAEKAEEESKNLDTLLSIFKKMTMNISALRKLPAQKCGDENYIFCYLENLFSGVRPEAIADNFLDIIDRVDYILYHVKRDKKMNNVQYQYMFDEREIE